MLVSVQSQNGCNALFTASPLPSRAWPTCSMPNCSCLLCYVSPFATSLAPSRRAQLRRDRPQGAGLSPLAASCANSSPAPNSQCLPGEPSSGVAVLKERLFRAAAGSDQVPAGMAPPPFPFTAGG